jgi:glycosyltransferase involved in cell wall biosynthesis
MRSPLITIIVATRNAARTLARCLDSVRGQTFRDWELVVMDGASTDGSVAILEARSAWIAHWRSEPDTGIYNAWNKALAIARGEWIAFLGADDYLADERVFEALAPTLRAALPAYRVVYGRVRLVDASGATLEVMGEPWQRVRERFRTRPCVPHPGLMHHRSLFEEHGRYDERFPMGADYELLLRELKSRDALFVPLDTVNMQQGGQTSSPQNFFVMLQEIRVILAKHGLAPPRLLWAYWSMLAWLYARLRLRIGDRAARTLADVYRMVTLRRPRYARDLDAAPLQRGKEPPQER